MTLVKQIIKHTATEPKPNPTLIIKNSSCVCVCVCVIVHNCHTQRSTVHRWTCFLWVAMIARVKIFSGINFFNSITH